MEGTWPDLVSGPVEVTLRRTLHAPTDVPTAGALIVGEEATGTFLVLSLVPVAGAATPSASPTA